MYDDGCITDVQGVRVGHAWHKAGGTGCTVVLCEQGAVAGVDIGGSAPGTRETEMLNPTNQVMKVHAVMLTGGSTFGLAAATGVQDYLVEKDIGFHASTGVVVPIVPAACIFDLDVGRSGIYPNQGMGLEACRNVGDERSESGSVGVGIGARVGKALGTEFAMRGGLGTAAEKLPGGVVVGVLAVCNAWGDVIDPESGEIVAGARDPKEKGRYLHTESWLFDQRKLDNRYFGMNTTLCVVATNVAFTREQMTKVARMAQDGIARATRPSHTMFDGDVVFSLSVGNRKSDVNIVGALAAQLVSRAIVRGVAAANEA